MKPAIVALSTALLLAAGCQPATDTQNPDAAAATGAAADRSDGDGVDAEARAQATARLAEVIASPHRSADNKARDRHRHPAETLAFFGVQPHHTVIELWPGGGWYTEILAPYLRDEGKLIVTIFDPNGPEAYYGTGQAKAMLARVENEADLYGKVETVAIPQKVEIGADGKVAKTELQPFTLAPDGTADVVLTFRNSHGWFRSGKQEMVYAAAFKALKSGGVFGVVQHRAAEGSDPAETVKGAYLPEKAVIDAAEAVGFVLAEKSEVNANPADTRDYPEGVWALPPSLARGETDRDKLLAIGESDRMTLKFVKP